MSTDVEVVEPETALIGAYFRLRQSLVRDLRMRLRSEEAAEDVVQDVYLKIMALGPDGIADPDAYLRRLARNAMVDRLRHQARSERREARWRDLNITMAEGVLVCEAAPADRVIAARQELAVVVEALNGMPEKPREAFRLHKFSGLSHAETAQAMNVSRSTVEKYIRACMQRIAASGSSDRVAMA